MELVVLEDYCAYVYFYMWVFVINGTETTVDGTSTRSDNLFACYTGAEIFGVF